MAKNRKKDIAHRVPPLSGADKAIYLLLSALLTAGILALLFWWNDIHDWIAFRNPAVIASSPGLSYLVVMPLMLLTEISGMIALICLWGGKQPIFGKKGIRYGEYPWKTDLFPLLGKQHKTVRRSASERRFRAAMCRFLLCAFLLSLVLCPFGLFERSCLLTDNTIVRYNILNQPEAPISIAEDCERLMVKAAYVHAARGAPYYTYGIVIYTADGCSYEFSNRQFDLRHHSHTDCLQQMLAIKALFSDDQITIEGTDYLPNVIEYYGLNEKQANQLQELFAG